MYPNPTLTPTEKPLTNFEQLVHEKIPTFEAMFDEQVNIGWPSLKGKAAEAHTRFDKRKIKPDTTSTPDMHTTLQIAKDGSELFVKDGIVFNKIGAEHASIWLELAQGIKPPTRFFSKQPVEPTVVPVAPILISKTGRPRIMHADSANQADTVIVASRFSGLNLEYLRYKMLRIRTGCSPGKDTQLLERLHAIQDELRIQYQTIDDQLKALGIEHRHFHSRNITVEFVDKDEQISNLEQSPKYDPNRFSLQKALIENRAPLARLIDLDAVIYHAPKRLYGKEPYVNRPAFVESLHSDNVHENVQALMALGKTQPEFIEDPEIAAGIEKSLEMLFKKTQGMTLNTNGNVKAYYMTALQETLAILDSILITMPTNIINLLKNKVTALGKGKVNEQWHIKNILERHKKMY